LNVIFIEYINDEHLFAIMRSIGKDLPFPDECVLLVDTIYLNRQPSLTPYSQTKLRLRSTEALDVNQYIKQYHVCVEH